MQYYIIATQDEMEVTVYRRSGDKWTVDVFDFILSITNCLSLTVKAKRKKTPSIKMIMYSIFSITQCGK